MTGCGIMSSVWDMILQCGSTIKVSIELPVATRHRRDMAEKLLKATLNSNTHTHTHTQFKWQQGTLLVIFYNGTCIYIYRYTFTICQYTFIGWVCGGPAAHLYQVYVRDTPRERIDTPSPGVLLFLGCRPSR